MVVSGHLLDMTKKLILITTLIITASWRPLVYQVNPLSYKIDIEYVSLMSKKITYEITPNGLNLSLNEFDGSKKSRKKTSKKSYSHFKQDKLSEFLFNSRWDTIPSQLSRSVLDGFYYKVNISLAEKTYSFLLDNTHHVVIDSLLKISNNLIPSTKQRNKYRIYFE